jgi:YVTN family beta-propeller protein
MWDRDRGRALPGHCRPAARRADVAQAGAKTRRRLAVLGTVLGAQLALAGGAWGSTGGTAYVLDGPSGVVSAFSTATNAPLPSPISLTAGLQNIAIAPNARIAFVTVNSPTRSVIPVDFGSDTTGNPIGLGTPGGGVAITPDGTTAYVTNPLTNQVTPIDATTGAPGTPIAVGTRPDSIAITPDGTTAYVTNTQSNSVTPIHTATNVPGTPITVGGFPFAVAVTPDGKTAYVTNFDDNTVTPISTATNTPGTPIPVDMHPDAIAASPSGNLAYVANFQSGTVTPLDTLTNTAGAPIPVGKGPIAVAFGLDGLTAYVVNDIDNTVTPIATSTNTPETPIPAGASPVAIAIAPATLTNIQLTPNPDSIAGRRQNGKCVAPTAGNRRHQHCQLPIAILASYQTDVASDVTLTFQQKLPGRTVNGKCVAATKQNSKHKSCTRLNSLAGRILQTARSGANTLNFGATIGRTHLGVGTYQLSFTPSGGAPVTKVLKITN